MKKLLVLAALFTGSLAAHAQTVDEVLDKYFAQIGGKDKWAAVQSMKMTGKAKVQGMELPFTVLQKAPNKMKVTASFQGKEIIQPAFDGTTAWGTNFMSMKPEKQSAEESESMVDASQIQDPFLNYAAKGYKAELMGKETIEGTECHKVKLTRKPEKVDGKPEENVSYYFFSVADNVPIMSRSTVKRGQAKGATVETYLSDYQEVNGMFVPFTTTIKYNGQTGQSLVTEKVEFNVPVDDKEFAFPAEGAK